MLINLHDTILLQLQQFSSILSWQQLPSQGFKFSSPRNAFLFVPMGHCCELLSEAM